MSYWSQFPDFDQDANAPIKEEFGRLARLKSWTGNSPEKREMYRTEWGKCFRSEFKEHYGDDVASLAGWQSLCQQVGLDEIPRSVKECKKAFKGRVWVNIVDLVDCHRTGNKVKCHKTMAALRAYTISERKIFPLEEAKQNGFLTALLINIFRK